MIGIRIFANGDAAHYAQAMAFLRTDLAAAAGCEVEVEFIDVLENPEAAEAAGVMATPTLICRTAGGTRRLVGNLGDLTGIRSYLAI